MIQLGWDPLLLYFIFRLLTCVPAVVVSVSHNAAEEASRFSLGLLVYAFVLSLAVAASYTLILRSRWAAGWREAKSRRLVLLTITLGVIDVVGGLWAVFHSGGWSSSPYWLVSLSSLIVPCLLFGIWSSFGIAIVYTLMHAVVVYMAGEGGVVVWTSSENYQYAGSLIIVFLVCTVTGYLGDMFSESNENKRRMEDTLRNLGTMLEITQSLASSASDVTERMCQVAQAIGERHHYDVVAIYLSEPGEQEFQLFGWLGELDDYEEFARQNDHFMRRAIATQDALFVQDGRSSKAAFPLRSHDSLLGVLVICSEESDEHIRDEGSLGEALASHIVTGLLTAQIRQRYPSLSSLDEWDQTTGEIHERLSGLTYGLMLHLESYAELAKRESNPLSQRLENLVTPSKELLLETRSYIFHLLPALRGQTNLFWVVECLVREFEKVTEIPVHLAFSGDDTQVPKPVVTTLCHILKHRMASVLRNGTASQFVVDLYIDSSTLRLALTDDGIVDDQVGGESGDSFGQIKQRAAEVGCDLEITHTEDPSTLIVLNLPMEDGNSRLDKPSDN